MSDDTYVNNVISEHETTDHALYEYMYMTNSKKSSAVNFESTLYKTVVWQSSISKHNYTL